MRNIQLIFVFLIPALPLQQLYTMHHQGELYLHEQPMAYKDESYVRGWKASYMLSNIEQRRQMSDEDLRAALYYNDHFASLRFGRKSYLSYILDEAAERGILHTLEGAYGANLIESLVKKARSRNALIPVWLLDKMVHYAWQADARKLAFSREKRLPIEAYVITYPYIPHQYHQRKREGDLLHALLAKTGTMPVSTYSLSDKERALAGTRLCSIYASCPEHRSMITQVRQRIEYGIGKPLIDNMGKPISQHTQKTAIEAHSPEMRWKHTTANPPSLYYTYAAKRFPSSRWTYVTNPAAINMATTSPHRQAHQGKSASLYQAYYNQVTFVHYMPNGTPCQSSTNDCSANAFHNATSTTNTSERTIDAHESNYQQGDRRQFYTQENRKRDQHPGTFHTCSKRHKPNQAHTRHYETQHDIGGPAAHCNDYERTQRSHHAQEIASDRDDIQPYSSDTDKLPSLRSVLPDFFS